ncbi:MAG: hypothetical protein R2873_18310 [Caldilineaceae bacterium]
MKQGGGASIAVISSTPPMWPVAVSSLAWKKLVRSTFPQNCLANSSTRPFRGEAGIGYTLLRLAQYRTEGRPRCRAFFLGRSNG